MKIENFKLKICDEGGDIAGGARKQLEKRLKRSIVTKENYLKAPQSRKVLPI